MAHLTLVNLSMLYLRYFDRVKQDLHLPLGPLYLAAALERQGFVVDFRDYQHGVQQVAAPFSIPDTVGWLESPAQGLARVVGFSCMTNLLPFTLLVMQELKRRHPDRVLVLGGVGPAGVEQQLLERFDAVDVIVRGEAEISAPLLLRALTRDGACGDECTGLDAVPGVSFRRGGKVQHNARPLRIDDLDALPGPAYHHVDLTRLQGLDLIGSRGCPYACSFCAVAALWSSRATYRAPAAIVEEMRALHERTGAELFLFQDDLFTSSRERVLDFCAALRRSGLRVKWKALGRLDLVDEQTLRAMAEAGCVDIRFGLESGAPDLRRQLRKGLASEERIADTVRMACGLFPQVDLFFVWGLPFETLEDFHRSTFSMIALQMMGARIVPSLFCLAPQHPLFTELGSGAEALEFAPDLFPEQMLTGHELLGQGTMSIRPEHQSIYELIQANVALFPGFFHLGLENKIRPKLRVLQELGFYPSPG